MLIETTLPAWQHVWRAGFCPLLTTAELTALAEGLRSDDEALIQVSTTFPSGLHICNDGELIQGGCALGYAIWKGRGLETVGEVYQAWADLCSEADKRIGIEGEHGRLLNFWDDSDRDTARAELLAEVERELAIRAEATP